MKKNDQNINKGFALRLLNIKKEFPGVKALKGVDFELKNGEVHALVGENGAGKSTLMKIVMGIYTKDSGKIFIDEKEIDIRSPESAHDNGIGMIFQELSLIPQLTIAQNIYLSVEPRKKIPMFVDDSNTIKKSVDLMNKYNIKLNPREYVYNLNRGYSQIVEVLKVLAQDTKIIVMDEPTASLTKSEEEILYKIINNLKNRGVSIIYISHRLEEIFNTCDRVTVLRDGLKVSTKKIKEIDMDDLVEMMTGKVLKKVRHHGTETAKCETEGDLLRVGNIHIKPRVNGVSFEIKAGEILGITGLMGSGKSEIARALFGIDKIDDGQIIMNEKELIIKNPSDAINAGIFLVPEDRRQEGLILSQTVESNLTLPILKAISTAGFVDGKKSSQRAKEQIGTLSIRTPSIRQMTAFLSGGNQQKVVIGKWLMENPTILILDEPTVGVDVKTKAELRNIISDLVSTRLCSVVLFSSELNEIIQLADRIIVLYRGTVFKEFNNLPPVEEAALHRAVQGLN